MALSPAARVYIYEFCYAPLVAFASLPLCSGAHSNYLGNMAMTPQEMASAFLYDSVSCSFKALIPKFLLEGNQVTLQGAPLNGYSMVLLSLTLEDGRCENVSVYLRQLANS